MMKYQRLTQKATTAICKINWSVEKFSSMVFQRMFFPWDVLHWAFSLYNYQNYPVEFSSDVVLSEWSIRPKIHMGLGSILIACYLTFKFFSREEIGCLLPYLVCKFQWVDIFPKRVHIFVSSMYNMGGQRRICQSLHNYTNKIWRFIDKCYGVQYTRLRWPTT